MISVEQYAVTKQSIQNKHIKIELLNNNLTPYYGVELSGNCIDGNVNVDATADIRRTCNILFAVDNATFDIGASHYIWLNRYIRLYVGIDSLTTGETVWFNQGVYIIDAPSVDYDPTNYTLRFTGLDLMANLTGMRNGYIEGVPTIIPSGSNVREVMISILKMGGITQYNISECLTSNGAVQDVPNDITIEQGGTIYDILVALRDIMPNYEIFFDVDGTFIYQPIPTGVNEPIIASDDLFKSMLLSESITTDFQSVKNVIEVYGRTITTEYFANNVVVTPNYNNSWTKIDLTVPSYVFDYDNTYSYIGFDLEEDINQPIIISINEEDEYILMWQDRDYVVGHSGNVSVLSADSYMINFGHLGVGIWELSQYGQIYAEVKDTNPNSPFYIGSEVGEIRKPLYGGEYDNITTNALAYQRAQWELYKATRLQDTIAMTLVPVYYFEVNQLISHAIKDTNVQNLYIIKNYSIDLKANGSMSLNAIRYYPEYPKI